MLDYLDMMGTYKERLVENTKVGEGVVDTVRVTDCDQPFETGVSHPLYNNGDWVIVEQYDTKAEAAKGHKKWVKILSQEELPESLTDVNQCSIAKIAEEVLGEKWTKDRVKKKKSK